MRVLYFHQYFTTPSGSGGIRSYEMAQELIKRGHSVTMVCAADERSGLRLPEVEPGLCHGFVDGIEVWQFLLVYSNKMPLVARAKVFFTFALKSCLLAAKLKYDVLFATSTPLTAGIPGIFAKFLGRTEAFVFEVRDLWPELPRAMGVVKNPAVLAGMSLLEWLSYRLSDGCVGLSPGIAQGIAHRAPPGHPIAFVPNGCDLDLFVPGERSTLKLQGIGPDDFVAAFTGAHGLANGLDAVLATAAELQRRGDRRIKIVLIGDGNQKERLVAKAADMGLKNVIFLPPIKKTELCKVTGSIDCGLQILANIPAFYFGTSPNKFFDYISAGRPVLNNYPGWLAGFISDNDCGTAVPPDDPAAFADALQSLGNDPEGCRRMGRNARQLAEREFNRDTLAEQWVAFLDRTHTQTVGAGL